MLIEFNLHLKMARIYGTIESLKSLKAKLHANRIHRFSSVKEINDFLKNYSNEKLNILKDESKKLKTEYLNTKSTLKLKENERLKIINNEAEKIDNLILELKGKIDSLISLNKNNFLKRILSIIKLYHLRKQLKYLIINGSSLIESATMNINQSIKIDETFIELYETNRERLIKNRAKSRISKIQHIKEVLESSRNLISGAIGENLVVKEIKKLSNDYVLINDFKLEFYKPIYYKKQNHRIYSIQIDHLLITKAGIFIIETKNWSKSSVNSISLRSPIEQIERSNFALYIYISENVNLFNHHWGEQTVPIRNLIVMIKNKPTGQFKYVSIKLLNELTNYVKYFDPVLTNEQFEKLVSKLK